MENINEDENLANMLRGGLYYAFTPRLTVSRMRCHNACDRFNRAGEVDRRRLVELWREYVLAFIIILLFQFRQFRQFRWGGNVSSVLTIF